MKRVSLVGTVHQEMGLANVSELQAILERIRPEVIFLEIPFAALDDFLDGRRWNLESSAAGRYRDLHHVELVPVDLPTPEEDFFRSIRYLNETVKRTSAVCSRLFYRDSRDVSTHGVVYLNSERCSKLWSDLYEAMLATIEELGDPGLLEIYETFRHTNELRDKAMLKRVEAYSTQNHFDKGVLLVGAAHRRSIIDKSRMGCGDRMPTVQWDFDGFLQGVH